MIELDPDLDVRCLPLAWMLGRWEGAGVGEWPDGGSYRFGQELVVAHDGRAFLSYESSSWVLDDDGAVIDAGPRETGYLRPVEPAEPAAGNGAGGGADAEAGVPGPGVSQPDVSGPDAHDTELLLAHADGLVELWLGRRDGARLQLATDAVVRVPGAPGRAAGSRLYGLVESDLLWAWDAGVDGRLTSVMSARLKKVGPPPAALVPPGLVTSGPAEPGADADGLPDQP